MNWIVLWMWVVGMGTNYWWALDIGQNPRMDRWTWAFIATWPVALPGLMVVGLSIRFWRFMRDWMEGPQDD